VRPVVAVDFIGFEREPLGFDLTEINHETGMDDYDAMAAFVFTLADRFVLIGSSVIIIQAHSAPVIGIQA
jgi:hypothetical protein